jgi:histidinol dehydrogenase
MQILEGFAASQAAIQQANARRAFSASSQLEANVRDICEAIKEHGDEALLGFSQKFDCPDLRIEDLRVGEAEIEAAWHSLSSEAKKALERAAKNIEAFHEAQKPRDFFFQSEQGAFLGNRFTAIERVGLYAPNGRAAYPSTVLMLAIPAKVAGVKSVVLATPASKDGKAHPVILAAAYLAGIREIYLMGGAAAMAAFAYGTATVPKVDKVVGPGSIYMTLAKKYLFGTVGVDGLYGPSEVAIVAEATSNPAQLAPQLAADLLAQAEHGGDSFVVFISPSQELCKAVLEELDSQANASPRAKLALETLKGSLLCQVESMEQACQLCDQIAAEHVEIWSHDALSWSAKIPNAGAIFLNCPVPLGDYIIGPSHTLPTNSTARFASGVGVDTFLKRTSLISAPKETIAALAQDLETIAHLEELPGHAAAVKRAAL